MIKRDRMGNIVVDKKVLHNDVFKPAMKPISSNPAFYKIFRVRSKVGSNFLLLFEILKIFFLNDNKYLLKVGNARCLECFFKRIIIVVGRRNDR